MAARLVNALRYFLTECPYVVSVQDLVTKTRVELDKDYTLDLYYNETLGKYGYTLILNNQRIVGWDNAPHHFHAPDGSIRPSSFTGNPEQDIVQVTTIINQILER